MLLNDLIKKLQRAQARHGNIKVIVNTDEDAFNGSIVNIAHDHIIQDYEVGTCFDDCNVVEGQPVFIIGA